MKSTTTPSPHAVDVDRPLPSELDVNGAVGCDGEEWLAGLARAIQFLQRPSAELKLPPVRGDRQAWLGLLLHARRASWSRGQ